jgi:hypothetical protein
MYKKPSSRLRHVTLDIETISTQPENLKGALSALTGRVACICMLIDDGGYGPHRLHHQPVLN